LILSIEAASQAHGAVGILYKLLVEIKIEGAVKVLKNKRFVHWNFLAHVLL